MFRLVTVSLEISEIGLVGEMELGRGRGGTGELLRSWWVMFAVTEEKTVEVRGN